MRSYYFLILWTLFQITPIHGYVSKCVKPGIKCADCEHLNHCVWTPRGLITHKLNFCNITNGKYCSVKDGGCSSDPSVCKIFGLNEIPCQNASTFPDPYDCTTFHQCVEQPDGSLTSIKHTCPEDRAFDPLSATCRFKPTHRVCRESPVPICLYRLQSGALKENTAIYYVCVEKGNDTEPIMYKCRTGEEYKANIHSCIEVMEAKSFACPKSGNYLDPDDSRKYFACKTDKTFVHRICEPGQYFDALRTSCQRMPFDL